ncbi:MAG: adenine deaminase C-terminal domain-containing protein [Desulfobacterales bacterium]|nr:adenine deaminase C-terminal domain-containing protein [Desulfobacterales bacterium]
MNGFGPLNAVKNRNSRLLMNVAMGKLAADLVITNASLMNVYTAEILENHAVGVKGDFIAYVGEAPEKLIGPATHCIDAAGKTLVPGYIDGHTHLAFMYGIDEFLRHAIPGGTTTLITEVMEPYPVSGVAGVLDFLASLQHQPVKIYATAPAMVSISEKTKGIRPEDLQTLLDRDDVLGLGESYWQAVLQSPEVYLPALEQTLQQGKVLEGHSAGARHHKLSAYAACGITSCHEPISAEEVLERLRLGFYVMAREGSIRRDLNAIAEIKDRNVDLRRLILCTDSIAPGELIEKGYMEHVVQQAVGYGIDPITAVQMVTLNVATHFSIEHLVGGIAPGRYADMLILPNPSTFSPELVISCGKVVARNGQLTVAPRKHPYSHQSKHSIALPKALTPADFIIQAPFSSKAVASVRVIEMVTDLVTAEKIMSLPVTNGAIEISADQNLLKIAAIDRTHTPGQLFTGLILGFGLKTGAFACSATWDASDIIVVGVDESDMALAVNSVAQLQGGAVLCANGQIISQLALPVFGLLSEAPMAEIAANIKAINERTIGLGVSFPDPLLSLNTLTGAAIPYLKICDEGLVNLKDGNLTGLFVEV